MKQPQRLFAVNIGIDTHEDPVVYMRSDCDVCLAEGFNANARLLVSAGAKSIIATLNMVIGDAPGIGLTSADSVGFSLNAWQFLGLAPGAPVTVQHAPVVASLRALRKKIYGGELSAAEYAAIVGDISQHRYSDIEVASFLTACAGGNMSTAEVIALTRAMIDVGNRLHWGEQNPVFDKHCVGGLPGNRTTPIVIAIASAAGLVMPKTSSRAITSPAGTADTMAVLTEVDLTQEELQRVVHEVGACLAWGGRVRLSPTDDLLIRVERALDLDGEGQLVASVLSKKIAAGSTHIVIDIPVGASAKVRSREQAARLSALFHAVADALKVQLQCVITDGSQPVGGGIGPAEEARDVIAVLNNQVDAPRDLAERSIFIAAHVLAMASGDDVGAALRQAQQILSSGRAWRQFQRICLAQGGLKEIPVAPYRREFYSDRQGHLREIDNRRLAQVAKLAGAPNSPVSGLRLKVRVGEALEVGQALLTLYAATPGELEYAAAYYARNENLFIIGEHQ